MIIISINYPLPTLVIIMGVVMIMGRGHDYRYLGLVACEDGLELVENTLCVAFVRGDSLVCVTQGLDCHTQMRGLHFFANAETVVRQRHL